MRRPDPHADKYLYTGQYSDGFSYANEYRNANKYRDADEYGNSVNRHSDKYRNADKHADTFYHPSSADFAVQPELDKHGFDHGGR